MIVTLDDELAAIVRQWITQGPYQTAAAVVRAALRQLAEQEHQAEHLRLSVAETDGQVERGETKGWTPELRDRVRRGVREPAPVGGPSCSDIAPGVCSLAIQRHVIVYRVKPDLVRILRVVRSDLGVEAAISDNEAAA